MATDKFSDIAKIESFQAPVGDPERIEQQSQGRTREIIAVWLLGLLCVVVGLAFTAYFLDYDSVPAEKRFANLKTLLDVLVGPIITLLSSAIGFYFGSRSAQAGAPGATGIPGSPGPAGTTGSPGAAGAPNVSGRASD